MAIHLYRLDQLLKALKSEGLSGNRMKFNWYENNKLIPEAPYLIHLHDTSIKGNPLMRAYTEADMKMFIELIRSIEKSQVK